jgi:hypothetical protein
LVNEDVIEFSLFCILNIIFPDKQNSVLKRN